MRRAQAFALETIATNDLSEDDAHLYVIALLAITAAFRALSTFLLARRAAAFF